jgi:hypothetical protein
MSTLPSTTGDAVLDFTLEAGPRTITPDTPEHIIAEIGKSKSLSPFREALRKMALGQRAQAHGAVMRTYEENQMLAQLPNANPALYPEARIPIDLVHLLEAQEKESWNSEMREDTLKCYPGLRLDYWR